MIDPQLEDKVVLVTGANHGIGAAIARAFGRQKASVFLTYFRNPCGYSGEELEKARRSGVGGDMLYRALQQQSAGSLLEEICAQGGTAAAWETDLGQPANIPLLFDQCESLLGHVDILINNHTLCELETFDPSLTNNEGSGTRLISAAGLDAHHAVNTRAYALMMAEYTARYLKRGASRGHVVNLSTDAAHAHEGNIHYAASKHAIESYSRSAAAELGKYGITVNIVAPGPVQTGWIPPAAEKDMASRTPLRRIGRPEDIADVVVFLASEQARWVTGQLLYVGGGWRMGQ